MMLSEAIRAQQHTVLLARHGLGDLTKEEARLAELFEDREGQFEAYLGTFPLLAKLTAPPAQEPSCLVAMGADEYFDTRGNLREQKHSVGHH